MRVPRGRDSRVELDDHLDDLASGDAEIVPLEIDALDCRLLRPRHLQRQTASGTISTATAMIRAVFM